MLSISRIYFGAFSESDHLRYTEDSHKKPVIVWNLEGRCNLRCIHCYASAKEKFEGKTLSTEEAKSVIDDLASFSVPVILLSGGEPLLRPDLTELVQYAAKMGIRVVLSTNGTLITREVAQRLSSSGIAYVGISLDGGPEINDRFRGKKGAFAMAIKGLRNMKNTGTKVGLRFTINIRNYQEIPKIFDIAQNEGVERICFYHLVYSGRGTRLMEEDLSKELRRETIDLIIEKTKESFDKGILIEVLTVDNHADAPYIFLKLMKENRKKAFDALKLFYLNKGNQSGNGIGAIDEEGNVHPDQFLREITLGNVREKPFKEIWNNKHGLLLKLRNKRAYIKGRCKVCNFFEICGGNFRARALAFFGDLWQEDPQCYLTDDEICFPLKDLQG